MIGSIEPVPDIILVRSDGTLEPKPEWNFYALANPEGGFRTTLEDIAMYGCGFLLLAFVLSCGILLAIGGHALLRWLLPT